MDKRFTLADQIEMLGWAVRGQVIAPAHPDYDEVRTVVVGQFDHRPAAVVRPVNATDVATVLNFAQATDLEIAVRSGGHSTCGHSGSAGGIVLDLRDLRGMEIDADAQTLWAGTGLNAGEVTAEVERHGMIVGFGDSASVGIGGLTLGGGIGYLVRKHGLTIDSLLAAELVTAAGDIIICDEANHPDLFWAIRGGGGNFGVVTRLKFRLHPLPSFVGGPMILPATPEVLAKFVAATEAAPDELSTIAMVMPLPPLPFIPAAFHGQLALVGMMAFAGDQAAADTALAPFRALQPLADMVRPGPYSSMYMPEDPTMRPAVAVRTLFMDEVGVEDASKIIATVTRSTAPMKMAQVRALGGAAGRVPAGATAFAHRKSRVMVAFLAMYDGGPDVQEAHDRWATDGIAELQQGEAGVYVNFLGTGEAARLRSAYPGATWDRLRKVKRQYDPENIFRLNQNIPPA